MYINLVRILIFRPLNNFTLHTLPVYKKSQKSTNEHSDPQFTIGYSLSVPVEKSCLGPWIEGFED